MRRLFWRRRRRSRRRSRPACRRRWSAPPSTRSAPPGSRPSRWRRRASGWVRASLYPSGRSGRGCHGSSATRPAVRSPDVTVSVCGTAPRGMLSLRSSCRCTCVITTVVAGGQTARRAASRHGALSLRQEPRSNLMPCSAACLQRFGRPPVRLRRRGRGGGRRRHGEHVARAVLCHGRARRPAHGPCAAAGRHAAGRPVARALP